MGNMNLRMLAWAVMIVFLPALGQATLPQEAAEAKQAQLKETAVYRVEYTVREFEDSKRLNSRTYTVALSPILGKTSQTSAFGRIRAISRVPFEYGEQKATQYQDIGINIDCALDEAENGVFVKTIFWSTSVVAPEAATGEGVNSVPTAPIARELRFEGKSLISLGKPTVISTLDDVTTNRRYEIEVTVTKVE